MTNLQELINKEKEKGYSEVNAEAKVCQDIILKAISKSSLNRSVTIKGGVVMRSKTNNIRRATQDMDIDFIRYSLADERIDAFINKLNCLEDIKIERTGTIKELKQQDYSGKRVLIIISDMKNNRINSKMDLGVHKQFEIEQEEYSFDVAYDNEGTNLLINSNEQMFAEKLKSLLKLGPFSTRYKDIYDMYYLKDYTDRKKLMKAFDIYIFTDDKMLENTVDDIVVRLNKIFTSKEYFKAISKYEKKWLDADISLIFYELKEYISKL